MGEDGRGGAGNAAKRFLASAASRASLLASRRLRALLTASGSAGSPTANLRSLYRRFSAARMATCLGQRQLTTPARLLALQAEQVIRTDYHKVGGGPKYFLGDFRGIFGGIAD